VNIRTIVAVEVGQAGFSNDKLRLDMLHARIHCSKQTRRMQRIHPSQTYICTPSLYPSAQTTISSDQRVWRLSDEGGSGGGLVLERRGNLLLLDVVTGETVDTGLDENHAAA
jgi:hypothetical protein